MSTPRKRRSFPRTLGECVEQVAKPALQSHGMAESKILRHWETIVGPALAAHATPHRIISTKSGNGDVLVVQCVGSLATEIQHAEPQILERIATYLGFRAIARLRIEQTARRAPAPAKKPDPERERMRENLHRLAESLQNTGDE